MSQDLSLANIRIDDDAVTVDDALRLLDAMAPKTKSYATVPERVAPVPTKKAALVAELGGLIASVLKLEPSDLSPERTWMDYGLDSVASTELASLFEKNFGVKLQPTIFFEFQNLDTFADYLLLHHGSELARRSAPVTPQTPAPAIRPREVAVSPRPDRPASIESLWFADAPASPPQPAPAPAIASEPSEGDLERAADFVARAEVRTLRRKAGGTIEYALYGTGTPLLLLGGLVMHYSVMWQLQLEEWGKRHRLVMIHMPGCGESTLYDELSIASIADDVAAVLRTEGIARSAVLGYSFGGVIAQVFALRHADLCSALAVCVSTSDAAGVDDFATLMRELQKSQRFMRVNRGWPMASLPAYGRATSALALTDQLHRLSVPTFVLAAAEDRYMPTERSATIAAAIPRAELLEVPDGGHLYGFTHHRHFNALILDFLARAAASSVGDASAATAGFSDPTPPGRSESGVFVPARPETLLGLEEYVRSREQGHTIMLAPALGQAARLLARHAAKSLGCGTSFRAYFLTSRLEALDSALRFARHRARNKAPASEGRILAVDPSASLSSVFDPLASGGLDALIGSVFSVESVEAAAARLGSETGGHVALVLMADASTTPETVARAQSLAQAGRALMILVEPNDVSQGTNGWLMPRLTTPCDLVVFGEAISGFQVPAGAMLVASTVENPWIMTPNEGYVRHPMANLGFATRIIRDHLQEALLPSAEERLALRRIATDPDANFQAHVDYGNAGYARVARMHGFDARFSEGRGLHSRVEIAGEPPRDVVDCLGNVGTSSRGLNPYDVIDAVAHGHLPDHDYWTDLAERLRGLYGSASVVPAASYVAALDKALSIAVLAANPRKKIICFAGGAAFSLMTGNVAKAGAYDSFRTPFQPLSGHVVTIEPDAPDAAARLEEELRNDAGIVWIETLQVEGNAVRPLPAALVALVERHRDAGYLVAVDETQTALWSGRARHSEGLIGRPDLVVLGTALTDGLLPIGAVLVGDDVLDRARAANGAHVQRLLAEGRCQLAAHLAAHTVEHSASRLATIGENGARLGKGLRELAERHPLVRDIRGEGLIYAIELDLRDRSAFLQQSFGYLLWGYMMRTPAISLAVVVCPILNHCLRIAPPLTITESEIDDILRRLDAALSVGVEDVVEACAAFNAARGDSRTAAFLRSAIGERGSARPTAAVVRGSSRAEERRLPRSVCIIGAGVSGICMAKALETKGIAFTCFESRNDLGGIWAYDEAGEHTCAWASLNMNTPKGHYQFADMPMPEAYPDFPTRQNVKDYLDAYIAKHDLRSRIVFGARVVSTVQEADGTWRVTLASGETHSFDALVVANGHHNEPLYPEYAKSGSYSGEVIHSQFYRSRHDCAGKAVMVAGIGHSGAQIAVDVSHDAKMTYLTIRRGVYILPHYLFGIRIDHVFGHLNDWWVKKLLPYPLHGMLLTGIYNLFIAKHRNLGMPKPDHWMMSCLPTIAENLGNRIGDGKIKIVADVDRMDGRTIHLKDGSSIEVDKIIYATGFKTTFPFFDNTFLDAADNKIPLFRRIFRPGTDNLAFVGAFQAITWGFLGIMERQATLIAEEFTGGYLRPSTEDQEAVIADERRLIDREYVASPRNQHELNGPTYMHELDLELRSGQKRARRARRWHGRGRRVPA